MIRFSKGETTFVCLYILRTPILKDDHMPIENANLSNLSFLTFLLTSAHWLYFESNVRRSLQRQATLKSQTVFYSVTLSRFLLA